MLAAIGYHVQHRLATLLRKRTLDLHRPRMVLDVRLLVGTGDIPLWPVVPPFATWLVLVAGHRLGAFVGLLAIRPELLRLGAAAASYLLPVRHRNGVSRKQSVGRL